jgi:hypothetical protein
MTNCKEGHQEGETKETNSILSSWFAKVISGLVFQGRDLRFKKQLAGRCVIPMAGPCEHGVN